MTRGSHNVVAMYVALLVHTVIFSLTESHITIMYLKHTIEDTYVEFNGRRLRLRREMQQCSLVFSSERLNTKPKLDNVLEGVAI
jgi:hypothetical protein